MRHSAAGRCTAGRFTTARAVHWPHHPLWVILLVSCALMWKVDWRESRRYGDDRARANGTGHPRWGMRALRRGRTVSPRWQFFSRLFFPSRSAPGAWDAVRHSWPWEGGRAPVRCRASQSSNRYRNVPAGNPRAGSSRAARPRPNVKPWSGGRPQMPTG